VNNMINANMITLAREVRGLTQAELAGLIGVSQGFLSKLEHGLTEPSDELLERLTNALRFPQSFFFLTEPIYGPSNACHYRRRQSAPVAKLRQLEARMNLARIRYEGLVSGVAIDYPNEFARMDIEDYDDSPEEVADLVRRMWNLPHGPISDLTYAVESAGGWVVKEAFDTDKVDELSLWIKGTSPFFFMNGDIPSDRYRWSLAHGVGHVFMHSMPRPEKVMEDDANRFAAQFLMPAAEIGSELESLSMQKLAQLKMRWKVSMQAIIQRAYDLGHLTDRQRKSFFTRLSQLGYRRREPNPLATEEPTVPRQLVEFHQAEHGYSVQNLAAVAYAMEPEFRTIYLPERPSRSGPSLRIVN